MIELGFPVLRPARRRAGDPAGLRARARSRDAHRAVPRLPRGDARPRRRDADRADDLRRDPRGLRLGALRDRRRRARSDEPHRLRRPRRPASGAPPRASRRPDLDGRAHPPRCVDDRRLALPRHGDGDDRGAERALVRARGARRPRARRSPAACRSTPGSASRPRSRRRARRRSRTASSSGSRAVQVAEDGPEALGAYVSSLRAALDLDSPMSALTSEPARSRRA